MIEPTLHREVPQRRRESRPDHLPWSLNDLAIMVLVLFVPLALAIIDHLPAEAAAPRVVRCVAAVPGMRRVVHRRAEARHERISRMSDTRLSIAELQRETLRWPTDWDPALGDEGEWLGFWQCEGRDGTEDRVSAETDEDYAKELAVRIASLANAAPVLLEIAAAALERQRCMANLESGVTDDWDAVERANIRISAALAKVRP